MHLGTANSFSKTILGVAECLLIVGICYVFAGSPPPAVNEAHYLAKAKHYWQPEWCAGDFFLESADAHEVFFWSFGWLTQFLSLPATAWTGRLLVWLLFALSWRRLVRTFTDRRGAAALAAILLLPLTFYGHLSGEWLIGGVEAKGFAYPLVFLAIAKAVEGRWSLVWPLLGLASSFHILVGGWAVIACLFAWWMRYREDNLDPRELAVALVVGGCLALPGLLPALGLSAEATAEQIREANITYTFRRLSHHLVPYRFAQWNPFAPHFNIVRPLSFGALCLAWWKLQGEVGGPRWQRLRLVILGSLVIAALGWAVDILSGPFDYFQIPPFQYARASLLRYYWFRMSDVMVAVGVALALVVRARYATTPRWQTTAAGLMACIALWSCAQQQGCLARGMSLQQQYWLGLNEDTPYPQVDEAWRDACRWFRDQTPPDIMVLTPVRQQTFKWYAQRPTVVSWKDVPQNAASIVEWWERRRAVYKLGTWPWNEPEQLELVLSTYHVTHIAWPDQGSLPITGTARQVYRNEFFRIFAVDVAPLRPSSTP